MPYEIGIFKVEGANSRGTARGASAAAVLRCQTSSQLGAEMAQAFKRLAVASITVGPLYVDGGTKRRLTDSEEREVWKAGCAASS